MQTMPTNDVFHHLLNLLRIHKEKDLILEMFEAQGIVISKSKLKSWALFAFIIRLCYCLFTA